MVWHLTFTHQILCARDLIGKHCGDEVFRPHAHELGRHFPAALKSRQSKRHSRHPTPPGGEHRGVEHGLDQHGTHALGVQITRDVLQFETVGRRERQYDIVFGGSHLQFEIELATETLA